MTTLTALLLVLCALVLLLYWLMDRCEWTGEDPRHG